MRFPRNIRMLKGHWEAAPVASVFFILVLFFLLKSSLVFPPGVAVDLPVATGFPGITRPTLSVAVDAQGQAFFEYRAVAAGELKQRLKEALSRYDEPVTLVLLADKNVPYSGLINYFQVARDAGIDEVLLTTRSTLMPEFTNE